MIVLLQINLAARFLYNWYESFRKIGGERGELGSAYGGGFESLFFPDEVVVAVEGDSSAEVSVYEVGGLRKNSKCVWDDWSKKRGAVPSSNADVIWIDGESD